MIFQVTSLKIKYNPFAKAFLDAKERTETSGTCQRETNSDHSSYTDGKLTAKNYFFQISSLPEERNLCAN